MSGPFIALTMPGGHGFDALPVFVNGSQIRSVHPRRVRRSDEDASTLAGAAAYEIDGTFVTTGDGEEGTFSVTQSYEEVTGAIRDAFA